MNNKILFFAVSVLLVCFFTADIHAQCLKKERPKWVDGFYAEFDNSYVTKVDAKDYNYDNAKTKALKQGLIERGFARAFRSNITIEGDQFYVEGRKELSTTFHKIDEYCEVVEEEQKNGPPYNVYIVHLLIQVAKYPNDDRLENLRTDIEYHFSGRVFVPGMAQIYKGQNLKGALFIAGEALFIGGLAASFGISSHYKDRHNNETNTERRNKYGDWANAAYYTGWTFVGLAAVLYIANIIDGVVSPGEEALFKIETDEKGKETSREKIKFVFAPTATFDSVGLAMNLNF